MYLAKSRRPSLLEHNNRYILLTTFQGPGASRLLMTSFATNIKSSILFRPGSPQGIGLMDFIGVVLESAGKFPLGSMPLHT
jgi:hypothetical protein